MNIVLLNLQNILKIKMNRRHIILIYKGEFLSFIFSVNNYILNTYM